MTARSHSFRVIPALCSAFGAVGGANRPAVAAPPRPPRPRPLLPPRPPRSPINSPRGATEPDRKVSVACSRPLASADVCRKRRPAGPGTLNEKACVPCKSPRARSQMRMFELTFLCTETMRPSRLAPRVGLSLSSSACIAVEPATRCISCKRLQCTFDWTHRQKWPSAGTVLRTAPHHGPE